MFSICIFLLVLKISSSFKFDLDIYSDKFDLIKLNNQDLYHTKNTKDSSKWLVFPLQLDYHNSFLKSKSSSLLKKTLKKNNQLKDIDSSLVIHHNDNSFWKTWSKYLNLHKDVEMKLVKESTKEISLNKIKQYQQFLYGFQVLGGDYKVTIGAHDGITHIHGHSFPTIDESYHYIQSIEDVPESSIKQEEELLKIFLSHDTLKNNDDNIDIIISSSQSTEKYSNINNNDQDIVNQYEIVDGLVELIWFENTSSKLIFVYHVKVNDKLNHKSHDVFIDFHSLQVVSVMNNPAYNTNNNHNNDKNEEVIDNIDNKIQTNAIGTSPFNSNSFTSKVIIYEVIPTVVFNSSDPSISAYPTAVDEINTLIDTTLYVKNLIYSLSNSDYITWKKKQRTLLIAYNEPGISGAQFNPGRFHGYTETISGLIYAYQSGSMNEAFSDIIGESIDILTRSDTVLNQKRRIEPTSCVEGSSAITKGTDKGARWMIGESLSEKGLRDMYKPECYGSPGYFHSPYYHCISTSADHGGVHVNSGVINHFYAVMVDGGFIREGVKPVSGIGLVKSLNIFWNAIQELTSLSQFQDFAVALSMTCENMIGEPIYNLNYLDDIITAVSSESELITTKDCRMIDTLIKESQINQKQPNCPNLVCGDSSIACEYARCSSSNITAAHEIFNFSMQTYYPEPLCGFDSYEYQSVARVFNQTMLGTSEFYLSCIEFPITTKGVNNIIISVYIDKTGGIPDEGSFKLIKRFNINAPNTNSRNALLTASDESSSKVLFENNFETLVVVMEFITKPNTNSFVLLSGISNPEVLSYVTNQKYDNIPINLQTYFTGPCKQGIYSSILSNLPNKNFVTATNIAQWPVKVTGSATPTTRNHNRNDDDSNDDLSQGEIAGLVIGLFFFGLLIGLVCYYLALRMYPNTSTNVTKEGYTSSEEDVLTAQQQQVEEGSGGDV